MHVIIETRKPGAPAWDAVGRFTASDQEIDELKTLLEGHEPLEVLDRLPRGLLWDVLDSIRLENHEVKVTFCEDH
jgi:hypothetical protein